MHRSLLTCSLAASMVVGCHVYKPEQSEPSPVPQAGTSGMVPMDSGVHPDANMSMPDSGENEAGMCIQQPMELCNLQDDDCDGHTDEDTQEGCEQIIPNGVAECVDLAGEARCVLRKCLNGFSNCDGDPTNGCEPYCICHDCPLDDAGEPVFTGDDGGAQ
jgi:hypothetical protein